MGRFIRKVFPKGRDLSLTLTVNKAVPAGEMGCTEMGSPSWQGDPEFSGLLHQEAALRILSCPFPSGLTGDKD